MSRSKEQKHRLGEFALSWVCTLVACAFAAGSMYFSILGATLINTDLRMQVMWGTGAVSSDIFKIALCHAAMRGPWLSRAKAGLAYVLCAGVSMFLAASYVEYTERLKVTAADQQLQMQVFEARQAVETWEDWQKEREKLQEELDAKRSQAASNQPMTADEAEAHRKLIPDRDQRAMFANAQLHKHDLYARLMSEASAIKQKLQKQVAQPTAQQQLLTAQMRTAQGCSAGAQRVLSGCSLSSSSVQGTTAQVSSLSVYWTTAQSWVLSHSFAVFLEVMVLVWVITAQALYPRAIEQSVSTRDNCSVSSAQRVLTEQSVSTRDNCSVSSAQRVLTEHGLSSAQRIEQSVVNELGQNGGSRVLSYRAWAALSGVSATTFKKWLLQLGPHSKVMRVESARGVELKLAHPPLKAVS